MPSPESQSVQPDHRRLGAQGGQPFVVGGDDAVAALHSHEVDRFAQREPLLVLWLISGRRQRYGQPDPATA